MTKKTRASARRRSLRASVLDGTFHAAMVGFGETFFAAFALVLGATPIQIGMLATLPILAGSLVQLAAPLGAARVGEKRWVVASATLQALVFVPILRLALVPDAGYLELLLWVCTYWALALGINPSWNAWMGRLVPERLRGRFFGRRNAPIHATLLLSVVAAGWVIELGTRLDLGPGGGFAIAFAIAALARLASAGVLARQIDPGVAHEETRPPVTEVLARFRAEPYGRLILLVVMMHAAVHVAAAYFTPFMLSELGLTYVEFTALTGAVVVSRVLSSAYWGQIASSYGNRRTLQVAAVMLVLLPGLWLVSDAFAYLLALQVFAGFAWAGFELATFLTFFDCTTPRNRAAVLTAYNLLNGVAIVLGSLLGGTLLALVPDGGYATVFALSTLLRALAFLAFARGVARRPGAVEHGFRDVFLRVVTLRPGQGPDDRPIILPRRR